MLHSTRSYLSLFVFCVIQINHSCHRHELWLKEGSEESMFMLYLENLEQYGLGSYNLLNLDKFNKLNRQKYFTRLWKLITLINIWGIKFNVNT